MSPNRSTIRTERRLLRPFDNADLNDWAGSIFADPEVTRYLRIGICRLALRLA